MTIWDGLFWKDTIERALFTAIQVLIAVLSVDGLDLVSIDVVGIASTIGIAVVLVVLKSVAANLAAKHAVSPASFATDDRGF